MMTERTDAGENLLSALPGNSRPEVSPQQVWISLSPERQREVTRILVSLIVRIVVNQSVPQGDPDLEQQPHHPEAH